MRWSLSSHKTFRRCQRQYYFSRIAAHHSARDNIRKEAYLLKQAKQLSAWKGSVIHQGISKFIVPYLQQREKIDWPLVREKTFDIAKKQFEFSKAGKFRQKGVTKTACEDYCILAEHIHGSNIAENLEDNVFNEIVSFFDNPIFQTDIIPFVEGHKFYYPEHNLSHLYEGAQIKAIPDLIFTSMEGNQTIVDWKVEQDRSYGEHNLQLALYAWTLWKKWNLKNPEVVGLYEIQLIEGKIIKHDLTLPLLEDLEDFMFQSIQEIRLLCGEHKYENQNLEDYEFARNPNSCIYCSFQKLCREVKQWEHTYSIFSR